MKKKKSMIIEGKTKKIFETDEPEQLIQEFKSDTSLLDNEKKGTVKGIGTFHNEISAYLFEYLEGFHVPTHFIKQLSNREMLVKRLDMIPVKVMVRNIATGDLCKTFGIEKGKQLEYPIIEYFLKKDELTNPMINTSHIISFGYAKSDEIKTIERLSSKINAVLKSFFNRRGFKLIDFDLEFGRYKSKILLGDELTTDSCRLWDEDTSEKYDAENLLKNIEQLDIVYENLRKRILKQSQS